MKRKNTLLWNLGTRPQRKMVRDYGVHKETVRVQGDSRWLCGLP